MTDDELYRCRLDLHDRNFPADAWGDAEIEALPQWRASIRHAGMYFLETTSDLHGYVDSGVFGVIAWIFLSKSMPVFQSYIEAVDHVENGRPTNRLAIRHLLPTNSVQPATWDTDFGP